jgi:hypothetical protein
MPFSFPTADIMWTGDESNRDRLARLQSDTFSFPTEKQPDTAESEQKTLFIVKKPVLHSQKGVLLSTTNRLGYRFKQVCLIIIDSSCYLFFHSYFLFFSFFFDFDVTFSLLFSSLRDMILPLNFWEILICWTVTRSI